MPKVYTRTVCPKCIIVKGLLEENGIEYELVNIDNDDNAREKLIDLGFSGVPIIEYNNEFLTENGQFFQLINELK